MIEDILKAHARDGILAALLIWLLIADRADRRKDRKFLEDLINRKDKEEKK